MQLLRELSQTLVETPRPAEKAGAARLQLLTVMPLFCKKMSPGPGGVGLHAFQMGVSNTQAAPGFVQVSILLSGSIPAEDQIFSWLQPLRIQNLHTCGTLLDW